MSYVYTDTISVSLSTVGDSTTPTYSSALNGLLHALMVKTTAAAPTTCTVNVMTTDSTTMGFRTKSIANSTLGLMFYPRFAVASSGASTALRSRLPLVNARLKVTVPVSSSGLSNGTMTIKAWVI